MKLASLKDNSRDGLLIVVDKTLKRAIRVPAIAKTMQEALDRWSEVKAPLTEIYEKLNIAPDIKNSFDIDFKSLNSPLPRAFQWADASAYVNHVELVRKARGAEMPENFWTDPLMYQGGSDTFLGPHDPILLESETYGCDFEAEIAVITDDVPMGTPKENARPHIQLLMLVNDVSLRNLIPSEISKSFGFFQSKPSSAFSPVAVTPDELGDAFKDGKVHLPLETHLNDALFGSPNAGCDMTFNFEELIAHAAKTRALGAGTIIGSGTVSNVDRSRGSSCIAERRMLEILEHKAAKTSFMKYGDRVKIEMLDKNRHSIFGSICQTVHPYVLKR